MVTNFEASLKKVFAQQLEANYQDFREPRLVLDNPRRLVGFGQTFISDEFYELADHCTFLRFKQKSVDFSPPSGPERKVKISEFEETTELLAAIAEILEQKAEEYPII